MKNKSLLLLPLGLVALLGVSPALAQSGSSLNKGQFKRPFHQMKPPVQNLEPVAQVLGISVDDLKTQLTQGKKIDDLLQAKGISKEQLKEQLDAGRINNVKDMLQKQVENGTLTQQQADTKLKEIQQRMQNGEQRMVHMKGGGPELLSQILGMTPQELGDQLKQEKKLTDIMKEKGFTQQDIQTKMIEKVKTDLDEQVQKGSISQEQADARLKQMQIHIEKQDFLNHPGKRVGHFLRHGPRMNKNVPSQPSV